MATEGQAQVTEPDGLVIRLLGGFRVSVAGRTIEATAWSRRKAAAIVKLLALEPRQQLRREQLTDLLWRDLEPQAAANNLRRTLHAARRALDPSAASPSPYLQGDPVILIDDGPIWVDVHAFEAAAAVARQTRVPVDFERAIGLYAGDLLPDDRYEDWAAIRRHPTRQPGRCTRGSSSAGSRGRMSMAQRRVPQYSGTTCPRP